MSEQNTNSEKTPGIVSPRFSNAANKANPDGSMGPPPVVAPGANSPVSQCSASPGTCATKSIMNVSGTSGAVVSNTPEPGLKRVPTVTFSDSKHLTLKQQAVANAANQQAKTSGAEENDKGDATSPKAKPVTSPSAGIPNSGSRLPSPPPLTSTDSTASAQRQGTAFGGAGRHDGKKGT